MPESTTTEFTEQDAQAKLQALDDELVAKRGERDRMNHAITKLVAKREQALRLVNAFKPRKRTTGKLLAPEAAE